MHAPHSAWSRAVAFGLAATAAAAVAAALAPLGWPFELFAHFRWQLGVAAVALLAAAALQRRPWMIALALAALLLPWLSSLSRVAVAPARSAAPSPAGCGAQQLTVVSANLWFRNRDPAPGVAWLRTSAADLIVVQELTPAWASALSALDDAYPHRRLLPRDDPYGIGLLSRWPLERVEAVDFAGDGLPSLVARLRLPQGSLQVIALHTPWPVLPELQQARDRVLARAAAQARTQPTVLLGDLNLSPYAPAFARLLADSGLQDAYAGLAWRPTWQAGVWPLALPIDHVLVPARECVLARAIGPSIGSDHRPLRVELRLP